MSVCGYVDEERAAYRLCEIFRRAAPRLGNGYPFLFFYEIVSTMYWQLRPNS